MTSKIPEKQAVFPSFPARAAAAILIAPLVLSGLFLLGFADRGAPALTYVAGVAALLIGFSLCSADILAFPTNARDELGHRLEIARYAGTSWFPDMRAEGRCCLLEIGELSSHATRQRDQCIVVFAGAAAFHLIICAAVLAGAITGRFGWSTAAWAGTVDAIASAYFGWLTAAYRKFGPVGPDRKKVLEAANLHLLCDQERMAELIGLIKKSA